LNPEVNLPESEARACSRANLHGSELGFAGKRVLVTGASRGIGAACARVFASLGASVAVHFRTGEDAARGVADELRAMGVRAETFRADLAKWDEGERLVAEAEEALGPLDVVVLNHGIWKGAPIDAMTAAEYEETLDVNLRGCFSISGAAVRRMKPRKTGRIVFVASTAAQRGEAFAPHYAASKGALVSLTKSLAPDLAPHGILVNCVAPGWVATEMSQAALDDPSLGESIRKTIPLARVATPEEIAWPIAFIASDRASFITGEIFNVNGGAVLVG
jgi:3-oxoacyl-[acyl-carrier protein] reductase